MPDAISLVRRQFTDYLEEVEMEGKALISEIVIYDALIGVTPEPDWSSPEAWTGALMPLLKSRRLLSDFIIHAHDHRRLAEREGDDKLCRSTLAAIAAYDEAESKRRKLQTDEVMGDDFFNRPQLQYIAEGVIRILNDFHHALIQARNSLRF